MSKKKRCRLCASLSSSSSSRRFKRDFIETFAIHLRLITRFACLSFIPLDSKTHTHARTEAKASHFNVMSNIFMSICRQARWPQLAERPSSRPAAGLCALSWTHCVSAPRQRRSSADCGDISGLTNRLQCHLSSGDIKHANLEGAVMVVVVGGSSHRNAPAMIQQPHGSD